MRAATGIYTAVLHALLRPVFHKVCGVYFSGRHESPLRRTQNIKTLTFPPSPASGLRCVLPYFSSIFFVIFLSKMRLARRCSYSFNGAAYFLSIINTPYFESRLLRCCVCRGEGGGILSSDPARQESAFCSHTHTPPLMHTRFSCGNERLDGSPTPLYHMLFMRSYVTCALTRGRIFFRSIVPYDIMWCNKKASGRPNVLLLTAVWTPDPAVAPK